MKRISKVIERIKMEKKRTPCDTSEKLILLIFMLSVLLGVVIIATEISSKAEHHNDLLEEEHRYQEMTNYSRIPVAQMNELPSEKVPQGKSLHRRNKTVKMGKKETLLILRSYLAHATKWKDVLDDVKQNISQLPPAAIQLYKTANEKQLRDRMLIKFEKLINQQAENIDDLDIRSAVQDIKMMERILVMRKPSQPREQDEDIRGVVAADTQINIDDKSPIQNGYQHRKKRTSIIDLIRQNLYGQN